MTVGLEDINKWKAWKADPNPKTLSHLFRQMEPVMFSATKINQGSISPAVIQAEAKIQALKAFKTYDPKHEVKLSTHVHNYLQKVNRLNYQYQEIFAVPEQRRIKYQTFQKAKQDLEDNLKREPNAEELADHLHWSRAEVGRFLSESKTELSDSQPHSSDLALHDVHSIRDATMMSYIYNDLPPKSKMLLEHTAGYNGQPVLTNPQLMKKFGMTLGQLSYAKKDLREHIQKAQQGGLGV